MVHSGNRDRFVCLRDNVDNAWIFRATLAGISLKLEDTNGCP